KLLASAGDEPSVQLWEVAAGKPGAKLTDHRDWVLCLAFSPDGKQLASGGYDGTVRLWDVAGGKKLSDLPVRPPPPPKTTPEPNAPVAALAFSPDGKTLVVGGAGGLIEQVHV